MWKTRNTTGKRTFSDIPCQNPDRLPTIGDKLLSNPPLHKSRRRSSCTRGPKFWTSSADKDPSTGQRSRKSQQRIHQTITVAVHHHRRVKRRHRHTLPNAITSHRPNVFHYSNNCFLRSQIETTLPSEQKLEWNIVHTSHQSCIPTTPSIVENCLPSPATSPTHRTDLEDYRQEQPTPSVGKQDQRVRTPWKKTDSPSYCFQNSDSCQQLKQNTKIIPPYTSRNRSSQVYDTTYTPHPAPIKRPNTK